MDGKIRRLGDAELEIMQVLWEAGEPVTSGYVLQHLTGLRGKWALSTVMTALARLADKGFAACDRSTRTNYYTPLISARDYKAAESRSFLERLYGNSVQSLVANLYDSRAIGDGDLEKLKKFIEEKEGGGGNA